MAKLNWDKANEYSPDPGATVQVPDVTRPYKHISEGEKARCRADRVAEEAVRIERVKAVRDAERLKAAAKEIRRKERRGELLTLWDRATLDRWQRVCTIVGL
jgi:hypothetical protein